MTPFYFGSSQSQLFGVHHAPAKSARDQCVVLVAPMGQEALRAHRALRQLAIQLARARFHSLRFDLSGTGDSAGAFDQATLSAWVDDVNTAADELRDRTGASRVSLVGLRLGAVLAWRASRARRDVDKLVLWEPVVHGGAYLADLQRRHEDFLHEEMPKRRRPPSTGEALGFPLVPALRAELMGLDLAAEADPTARAIHALIAHETDDERRLARRLEERAPRSSYAKLSLARDWNSEEAVNSSLVPAAALEAIVASMEAR